MKNEKYRIDLERHHLEKIKKLYTVFKFSEGVDYSDEDFDITKKLIPFEDFVIALAPMMETHHKRLDQSSGFSYNTQLALNRLMHLYELIQFPFIEGFDHQSSFLDEFQGKTAMIDGNEVKIWEDIDSQIIEKWIKRWLLVKKEGYDAFFLNEKIGYSNFYKFRYLPIEEDFKLFLMGKGPTNEDLFLDENKRNKFWQWFLSTYLRENVYPLM